MSRLYLLDTNTFSYIAKGSSPAARGTMQRRIAESDTIVAISVITEAEIRFGMARHGLSQQRRQAIEHLLAHFAILPWQSKEALAYAETRHELETHGITLATMDLLIAAHAVATEAVLVTRDHVFTRVRMLRSIEDWATDL
ncbi:PIN domain-containing protein [Acidicapsa dinghuensis]|uniref:Ribonuclease VapC n=1 Tax=Acidicapsa dinghuensis TaxID=2218256 RepID=A0ABW1EKG2_9BACT|nr:PIN domain-containing protein [Acidicapsa dinghuensis]